MAKRGGFPGGASFGGMNINKLMKEAKKMQSDMEKSQEELTAREFEATAGGGAVSVKVSGAKEIKEINFRFIHTIINSKTQPNFNKLHSI